MGWGEVGCGGQEPEVTPELGQHRGDRAVEFNSAEANLDRSQVFVGPHGFPLPARLGWLSHRVALANRQDLWSATNLR